MDFSVAYFLDDLDSTKFKGAMKVRLNDQDRGGKLVKLGKEAVDYDGLDGTWRVYTNIKPKEFVDAGTLQINLFESFKRKGSGHFSANLLEYFHLPMEETVLSCNIPGNHVLYVVLKQSNVANPFLTPPRAQLSILTTVQYNPSPSSAATYSECIKTQRSEYPGAIFNGRPLSLWPCPISIYNEAFFRFGCMLDEPETPNLEELTNAVEFIKRSLTFYHLEATRCTEIKSALDKLLGKTGTLDGSELPRRNEFLNAETGSAPRKQSQEGSSKGKPPACDGIVRVGLDSTLIPFGLASATTLIIEVRNENGEGGCDPMVQAQHSYQCVCAASKYGFICAHTSAPCFVLTISGPYIQIGGMVFAEHFITEILTDSIYVGPQRGEQDLRPAATRVAQIFKALRTCIVQLEGTYTALKHTDPTLPIQIPTFPSPNFNRFTSEGVLWKITYQARLNSDCSPVFKATCECQDPSNFGETRTVVVKFSARYCVEAHRLLADVSLAPKIFYHEAYLGLFVTVMDFVETVNMESLDIEMKEKAINDVKKGVEILHENGYVHGDIRDPNVLVTEEGAKIIDMDWANEEGKALYPLIINPSVSWPSGATPGDIILKSHDDVMMERLYLRALAQAS